MAKKIDSALKNLVEAVEKHAEVASDKKAKRAKVEKAAGKVRAAAIAYGSVAAARTGTNSPFADIADPRLDEPTVQSLKAERDVIAEKRKSKATRAPGN